MGDDTAMATVSLDRKGKKKHSKAGVECLNYISSINKKVIWHAENGGEVRCLFNGKMVSVDGYEPETMTIYEYNGDMYHPNPLLHNMDSQWPSGATAGEIYDRHQGMLSFFRSIGFRYVVVSEMEWRSVAKKRDITIDVSVMGDATPSPRASSPPKTPIGGRSLSVITSAVISSPGTSPTITRSPSHITITSTPTTTTSTEIPASPSACIDVVILTKEGSPNVSTLPPGLATISVLPSDSGKISYRKREIESVSSVMISWKSTVGKSLDAMSRLMGTSLHFILPEGVVTASVYYLIHGLILATLDDLFPGLLRERELFSRSSTVTDISDRMEARFEHYAPVTEKAFGALPKKWIKQLNRMAFRLYGVTVRDTGDGYEMTLHRQK